MHACGKELQSSLCTAKLALWTSSPLRRSLLLRDHGCMDARTQRFALGLTEAEVDRLRDILRRTRGLTLTREEAWAKAIQLLSLGLTLLQATSPKRHSGSKVVPLDGSSKLAHH